MRHSIALIKYLQVLDLTPTSLYYVQSEDFFYECLSRKDYIEKAKKKFRKARKLDTSIIGYAVYDMRYYPLKPKAVVFSFVFEPYRMLGVPDWHSWHSADDSCTNIKTQIALKDKNMYSIALLATDEAKTEIVLAPKYSIMSFAKLSLGECMSKGWAIYLDAIRSDCSVVGYAVFDIVVGEVNIQDCIDFRYVSKEYTHLKENIILKLGGITG